MEESVVCFGQYRANGSGVGPVANNKTQNRDTAGLKVSD